MEENDKSRWWRGKFWGLIFIFRYLVFRQHVRVRDKNKLLSFELVCLIIN